MPQSQLPRIRTQRPPLPPRRPLSATIQLGGPSAAPLPRQLKIMTWGMELTNYLKCNLQEHTHTRTHTHTRRLNLFSQSQS